MPKYRMVPEAEYQRLQAAARALAEISSSLTDAPTIEMSIPGAPPPKPTKAKAAPTMDAASASMNGRKYKVGRKNWNWAEVAARELAGEFSLDEAMDTLMPLIETKATRPRDSLRVAMDRDDRFERIDRGEGVWYRRIDPSQIELEEEGQT